MIRDTGSYDLMKYLENDKIRVVVRYIMCWAIHIVLILAGFLK